MTDHREVKQIFQEGHQRPISQSLSYYSAGLSAAVLSLRRGQNRTISVLAAEASSKQKDASVSGHV